MARIQEYDQQSASAGPVDQRRVQASDLNQGAAAFDAAGKVLGSIGDYVEKSAAQNDAIDVNKKVSEIYLAQTQKLQKMRDDGSITDKQALEKFQEDFNNQFSMVADGLVTGAGRKLLAEKQNTLTQHFGASIIQQSGQAKGEQAKNSAQESLNNLSGALVTKPEDFDLNKAQWAQNINGMHAAGLINPEEAKALELHGNKILYDSKIKGMININPYEAKAYLETDESNKYIDGVHKDQLLNEANVNIRAREVDVERGKREAKEKLDEAATQEINNFLPKIYSNEYTTKQVLSSKTLSPVQKEHYIGLINRQATGEAKNHPEVANQIYKDIMNRKILTPDEITAFVGNGIDMHNAQYLSKVLVDVRDPETGIKDSEAKKAVFKEAEKTLLKNPVLGPDPDGQRRLNAFRFEMEDAWVAGRKAGKSTAQLTDPKSPDYIGNLIQKYQATTNEIFDSKMRGLKNNKENGYTTSIVPLPESPNAVPPGVTAIPAGTPNSVQEAAAAELARRRAAKGKK